MHNHSSLPSKNFFVKCILGKLEVAELQQTHGQAFEAVLEHRYRQYLQTCQQAQAAVANMLEGRR